MNKKTLIIITTLLIIAGLIWFFWFKTPSEPGQEGEKSIFSYLFPTGDEKPLPASPTAGLPANGIINQPIIKGNLIQLTQKPISGATFDEKTNKIRYIEKATGHLYEINPNGTEKKQLTITTIPKIFEVFWSKDAEKAVLRYIGENNIYTFLASFSSTTPQGTGQTEGVFLPSSTITAVVSPSEDNVFYLLKNNETKGITSSLENTNKKEIFSSIFSEFLPDWPQKNTITLLTKPSAGTAGYLYKLNPQTGAFTKILGGYSGLTASYSPIDDKTIVSISEPNSFITKIYDESDQEFSGLGVTTLPEKCLFSKKNEHIVYCAAPRNLPAANYPDDWYQGLIVFSDTFWKIDLDKGSTEMIFNQEDFDAISLFSDKEENYLFFQNKKDSTLWSLRFMDMVL